MVRGLSSRRNFARTPAHSHGTGLEVSGSRWEQTAAIIERFFAAKAEHLK
jgi:hypothetical protein